MFDHIPDDVLSPSIRALAATLQEATAEWFEFGFSLDQQEDDTWEAHLTLRTLLLPAQRPPLLDIKGVGRNANAAVTDLATSILTALQESADCDIEAARLDLAAALRVIK